MSTSEYASKKRARDESDPDDGDPGQPKAKRRVRVSVSTAEERAKRKLLKFWTSSNVRDFEGGRNAFQAAPFKRLVRERIKTLLLENDYGNFPPIASSKSTHAPGSDSPDQKITNVTMRSSVPEALIVALEQYLVDVVFDSTIVASNANRSTLSDKHIRAAMFIRNDPWDYTPRSTKDDAGDAESVENGKIVGSQPSCWYNSKPGTFGAYRPEKKKRRAPKKSARNGSTAVKKETKNKAAAPSGKQKSIRKISKATGAPAPAVVKVKKEKYARSAPVQTSIAAAVERADQARAVRIKREPICDPRSPSPQDSPSTPPTPVESAGPSARDDDVSSDDDGLLSSSEDDSDDDDLLSSSDDDEGLLSPSDDDDDDDDEGDDGDENEEGFFDIEDFAEDK